MNKKITAITVAAVLGLSGTVIGLSKDSNIKYGFEPAKAQTSKISESSQEVTTFFQELEQKSTIAGLICGQYDEVFGNKDYTFYNLYGRIIDTDTFMEGYEKGCENVQKIKAIKATNLPEGAKYIDLEHISKLKLENLMQEWNFFAKKWGFEDIKNMDRIQIKSLLTGISCGQYDGMYFDDDIVPSTINPQYQENKDEIDKTMYELGYQKGFSNISPNRSSLTEQDKQEILSELTIANIFWNNQQSNSLIFKKK